MNKSILSITSKNTPEIVTVKNPETADEPVTSQPHNTEQTTDESSSKSTSSFPQTDRLTPAEQIACLSKYIEEHKYYLNHISMMNTPLSTIEFTSDPLTQELDLAKKHQIIQEFLENPQPPADKSRLGYKIKLSRLISTIKLLIDNYGDEIVIGVDMVTDNSVIHLFLVTPDQRLFALMLRTNGKRFVQWREDKQALFTYKSGRKGLTKWDSITKDIDALQSIIPYKKKNSHLFGSSNKQRNRPITRAIVLCEPTKISHLNPPEYWTEFGQAKVLRIFAGGIAYVVEKESLIDFLKLPTSKSK